MSEMLLEALAYAELKHKGQVDKAGVSYIEHPKKVASMVEGEEAKIVAILHDTVEDTDATIEEIREMFGNRIADAVDYLTRDKAVPYIEYIERVKKNDLARTVKIADIRHNMDISRILNPSDKDYKRLEKYKKAIVVLNG